MGRQCRRLSRAEEIRENQSEKHNELVFFPPILSFFTFGTIRHQDLLPVTEEVNENEKKLKNMSKKTDDKLK